MDENAQRNKTTHIGCMKSLKVCVGAFWQEKY